MAVFGHPSGPGPVRTPISLPVGFRFGLTSRPLYRSSSGYIATIRGRPVVQRIEIECDIKGVS